MKRTRWRSFTQKLLNKSFVGRVLAWYSLKMGSLCHGRFNNLAFHSLPENANRRGRLNLCIFSLPDLLVWTTSAGSTGVHINEAWLCRGKAGTLLTRIMASGGLQSNDWFWTGAMHACIVSFKIFSRHGQRLGYEWHELDFLSTFADRKVE